MLLGHVRDFAARVLLTLPGEEEDITAEFVVDTGFEGDLSLPRSIAAKLLRPSPYETRIFAMADGSLRELLICVIALEWDEQLRSVEALVTEGRPLLGMALMDGSYIGIDNRSGGEVSVEPQ